MALASAYKSRDGMSASAHMFSHTGTPLPALLLKGLPGHPSLPLILKSPLLLSLPHVSQVQLQLQGCTGKLLAFSP